MTAGPEVKTLDAIITQLGLSLLVVGRNAQGFASSRKPVGPMTIVSLHVGTSSQVHSALSPKNAVSLIRLDAACHHCARGAVQ